MKFANGSDFYESQLILEASKGDLDAFNHLVLKYQDLAFNRAYGLLGDRHSSADATQVSFIKVFQNINGFQAGSFRAWLLKIVTNTCYDEMRRSKRHPTTPLISEEEDGEDIESPAWLADPKRSVQAIVERKELSRILCRMLDELPEIYRNPITLIDLHELDYSEAAEVLEIPIGTVKSRLARARHQMKEKLQNNFGFSKSFSLADARLVA
jgi:RNA polymerase sigma-70 factor (ECF subfamily)